MCAVGHFLEEEGLSTVSISLVRQHADAIKPPRSLWVPFELGRPLGIPNNPEFQLEVLQAALNMLTSENGPVLLENYQKNAPNVAIDMTGWACPVSLKVPPLEVNDYESSIVEEMTSLQPWYELARKERLGRSTFGLTGVDITSLGSFIASYLSDKPQPSYRTDLGVGDALKLACDDIKAFYFEAAAAQPGPSTNIVLEDWFWGSTTAGKLFIKLKSVCLNSDDRVMKALGNLTLVPRSQLSKLHIEYVENK